MEPMLAITREGKPELEISLGVLDGLRDLPSFVGDEVSAWVGQAEQFFGRLGIPEELWVSVAFLVMEGRAQSWYEYWEVTTEGFEWTKGFKWERFKQALLKRFQPEIFSTRMETVTEKKKVETRGKEKIQNGRDELEKDTNEDGSKGGEDCPRKIDETEEIIRNEAVVQKEIASLQQEPHLGGAVMSNHQLLPSCTRKTGQMVKETVRHWNPNSAILEMEGKRWPQSRVIVRKRQNRTDTKMKRRIDALERSIQELRAGRHQDHEIMRADCNIVRAMQGSIAKLMQSMDELLCHLCGMLDNRNVDRVVEGDDWEEQRGPILCETVVRKSYDGRTAPPPESPWEESDTAKRLAGEMLAEIAGALGFLLNEEKGKRTVVNAQESGGKRETGRRELAGPGVEQMGQTQMKQASQIKWPR